MVGKVSIGVAAHQPVKKLQRAALRTTSSLPPRQRIAFLAAGPSI